MNHLKVELRKMWTRHLSDWVMHFGTPLGDYYYKQFVYEYEQYQKESDK